MVTPRSGHFAMKYRLANLIARSTSPCFGNCCAAAIDPKKTSNDNHDIRILKDISFLDKTGVANIKTVPVGNHPDGICIDDFNKDGKNDLAVTNQADGTLMILLNK